MLSDLHSVNHVFGYPSLTVAGCYQTNRTIFLILTEGDYDMKKDKNLKKLTKVELKKVVGGAKHKRGGGCCGGGW